MKKVITPAALKHIIVPFFAFILIFCNSLNFIKAEDQQTAQATALGSIQSSEGITFVVDCSVTGNSIYNDSLRVWNTYPQFHAYVIASEPVNGYITFRFDYEYYMAGSDTQYINLMVTLTNGYGELVLTGSESYNYGGIYTNCSISNIEPYVISTTEYGSAATSESIEDYAIDISDSGIISTLSDTAYSGSTLTSDNYYVIHIAENQQANTIYVIKSNIGSRNDVTAAVSEIYSGNALGSLSSVSNLDSYVINNRTSSTIFMNSNYNAMANKYIAFKFTLSSSMSLVSGIDMVIYAIPLESDLYIEYYNLMNYNRIFETITADLTDMMASLENIDTGLDDANTSLSSIDTDLDNVNNYLYAISEKLSMVTLSLSNLEDDVSASKGLLYTINSFVQRIYNFLTDGSDTETTSAIDDTVTELVDASSTVESTQSDFTQQLQQYSSGIDLDNYDFSSSNEYQTANTYYKWVLQSTYNNSGEFKYLIIIPVILAVFCFIVGAV